ncbi:MAG: precorrin-6y C5,15-methyltransferase (decarboxylating) subunit CbiE [Deltaproteobacteria bacterium]|nr:precorrin-6y C5,15-methyltransferase (decarboxylating) subunit CbiE [Deltaproteobacteria bacterium]
MIYIIGIGIEGKASLSRWALKLIEKATLLIGGRRHLACFPEFQGRKVVIGSNLDEVAKRIQEGSKVKGQGSKKNIVVLASGDPNFFGIADFLIKKFGKKAVKIIPNVSTMQEAFARIKENWNDARFLSLHGRVATGFSLRNQKSGVKSQRENIIAEISRFNKIGIFTDPENTPSQIAKVLLERGIKDYKAYVCEDLGTAKENITQGTLFQIVRKKFLPLNVMILIRCQGSRVKGQEISWYSLGIPDSEFSYSRGMITKEEIRVISLSKLKLKQDSIVWDIGAGSGSLSIEAAMLANEGKVFAVEKDAARIKHIEKNKKKFKVANIEIIHKNAPDGLKKLPTPDAVFIGGGGEDISRILTVCSKKMRCGGSIIVNAITLETLKTAADFFNKVDWNTETVSVNIAKAKDVAGLHLFNAYNPVFIIVGEKP